MNDIESQVLLEIEKKINNIQTENEFNNLKISVFGKNGQFNKLLDVLKDATIEEKKVLGMKINKAKEMINTLFEAKLRQLNEKALTESIDVTLPGKSIKHGHLHIVTQAISEISSIFEKIGFSRTRYPEVEWEWYAFEALNMPENHPARDDFETFFVEGISNEKFGKGVLSPHTSSGQVREMERMGKPPIRMINIAKCYRPNWDVSHTPMFHQFEGLVIDKSINITHLKGTMDYFAKEFFGKERKTRLRPFHFQFTEPSFEVDISCGVCLGTGSIKKGLKCRFCKEGWLELGGSGMVHPNVLKAGNIDPSEYTGFAFGWGIERTYMMKSGTKLGDLRMLYENDVRFLNQF
jgi:phenylalanyl-tRNA synthetase alpha chain